MSDLTYTHGDARQTAGVAERAHHLSAILRPGLSRQAAEIRLGGSRMKRSKRNHLEQAGWRVGTVREFLDLTDEELALVEIRVSLAIGVRNRRVRRKLTQVELADLMGSSQSRVAKMESGDESVSMDLLVRALLALGATRKDVAKMVGTEAA